MKVRIAALIINNGKVLTMKYLYGGTPVNNLPGGNLELFETAEDCLTRELQEELGLACTLGPLTLLAQIQRQDADIALHMIYSVIATNGQPILNPAETTAHSIEWLDADQIQQANLYPNLTEAIVAILNHQEVPLYQGLVKQPWY